MTALIIIVMGVSGSGKTSVGRQLADELNCSFYEGDNLHPDSNVAKMAQGIPLDDMDRWPWLQKIRALITDLHQNDQTAVISCSALKQSYRDYLQSPQKPVQFIYLKVDFPVLQQRLNQRSDHFMPDSLLDSQLAALEEPSTALWINANRSLNQITDDIHSRLNTLTQ